MYNVNNNIEDDLNKTIEILKHFVNMDDCDINELKKEHVILSSTKHYYEKCKELLDKYPDDIPLGKHVTVYTAYYKWRSTICVGMSLNDDIAENLYGSYYTSYEDICIYFENLLNMLITHNRHDKVLDDFSIDNLNFSEWYDQASFIQTIDNSINRLEENFEELIKLSKDAKFTNMLDTLIENYTDYLMTSKEDE